MTGSRKVLLVAVAMLLFVAPAAFADSLVAVDGTYAFGNNGYGIPPYGGTLNGQAAEFYCVDFSHDIKGGDSWKAVVTDLSTNPASFGSTYLNDKNTYLKFIWLVTQMMGTSDQTAKAADQWAIWSLTGGIDPFTGQYSAQTLLQNADSAVIGGFTGQGWDILTPDVGQYGQEFLIQTPEPSGLLLLAVGLCGLFLHSYRERLVRPDSRERN
jgi:PEP-CTERM motif